ncbi:probable cation-transporting ATPase 1 [Aspergillus udagawae]|uniref:Probable cation-transporting ATPase 1 n=1 Tax=Aspergillus udagawae TaxID=91492 RepID=A0ABQ1B3D1_9EURO|nr:probable cation-transporting ATPase 1 [Aspergillus udagawae]GFF41213.1 probable cation-transporting ATPase 1 [Aspergillus udagawae]GFF92990.1 probable cation-transporting ATPase 1 [Aspergillus udagawae]
MLHFPDRSASIFIVTIVFLGLSFIAVCLRCFVRLRLVKAFGWDDTIMVAAMALNILFALCGITGSLYGMGRKLDHVERKHFSTALFWWWLGQTSYVVTVVVAKISIAVALLRLTVTKIHAILLWTVIGVTIVVGLVFWFVLTLQCKPVSYFWNRMSPGAEGTCLSTDTIINIAYLYSVTATLCDFVLGLLPISLVWKLQMTRKTKIALAGILSMGCIASSAVIVRIPYLHYYKAHEFLYETTDISIWSNVEASLGIMAGSLVTLRPLFRWFRRSSYGRSRTTKKTFGSVPLSSMNGNGKGAHQSKHDRDATQYWRPDVYPHDSRAVVTTVQTSPRGSKSSSQEDLNPKQEPLHVLRAKLVDDPQIKYASLHNPLPTQLHTYVWPFLIIWPAFFAVYLSPERYDTYIQGQEWTFVWSGSIITAQSLLWLMTKWNINIQTLFTATKARSLDSAQLIKVIPVANAGSAEICPLHCDTMGGKKTFSFLFQKRRFLYYPERQCFAPLSYVLDAEPKPPIKFFQQTQGLTVKEEIDRIQHHYGDNTFDIPVPTFVELFKEHAVAPFFVFQVFCVGLWMLDEYWYYSLFTLFMLVVFESTVVWQRQRTLNEFRGMNIKPYDVWVYRQRKWQELTSDKLLPGDLMSVNRTKEDSGVACDILLIEGSAIVNEAMLSGESTPLLKESIQLRPADDLIEPDGLDKNAFVHGGTKVLQITHHSSNGEDSENSRKLSSGVPLPPDNGAVGVVVKTGFETSQGSLVRTMIYSTERVSANNVEALLFILFLLIFAIAAAWYVWQEGVLKDRKRSKLLLDCVLIVTSVVPPELPMELSLAVNTSLAALSKFAIFCTEPFRIPFAGRVDIACFDKTGTLTGEDLVVDGIAGLTLGHEGANIGKDGAHTELAKSAHIPFHTTLVLASAHALVKLDEGEVVGDPMEKATLQWLGWTLGRNDTLMSKAAQPAGPRALESVQIKRRFQFSSALKRQSTIATVTTTDRKTSKKTKATFVGVKGAPETIRTMLINTPPHYEETFKYFTRNGARVLALAYKYLSAESDLSQGRINGYVREEIEADLVFAGFLVLQCPLKEDAIKSVRMLNESSHRVVMITGDNPLTAVHVARQVEIVDRDVLILDAPENDMSGTRLVWRSIDDKFNRDVDPTQDLDPEIIETKDICITGYALGKFKGQKAFSTLLRHTWVYARVSPKQKEDILLGLKDAGYTTLMCGDGTNDVGALKQAHVGVALLNGSPEDLAKIAEHYRTTKMKEIYEKQVAMMQRFNQPAPPVPVHIAHLYPPGPRNPHYQKAMEREAQRKGAATLATAGDKEEHIPTITSPGAQALQQSNANLTPQQQRQQQASIAAAGFADKLTSSMLEQELDDSEPPTIKLGDASVAAPFTSKLANVIAIPNILRQGRCTLVATIQMYKILALNCLISAYSLSVIYLDGIKFGDGQVTISGMLMSVCFLSISRAKSVEGLSKERPQPNIFNMYIIGSVLGQFAIHIATLIYLSNYVYSIEPRKSDIDLEGEFEPSLLNSAIYLLQLIQQISTFSINYQGRPFRESIRENKAMYWGLVAASGVAFSCATEFIPELNEKMRLVPFSTEFKVTLTVLMVFDYAGCWIIENVLKNLFSDFRPKDIAVRRPDQLQREMERKKQEELESQAEKDRQRKV